MDGQTAVITGASRGIGRAVAREFATAGAHVVICSRNKDDIEDVAAEIEDAGGSATAMRTDVRDEFDVERLMETAAREGDVIDYVVANAGVYHGTLGETPLDTESYAAFDDHMRTNARGVFATLREAMPHLADDARILVTSGSVARSSVEGFGSYAVSKTAAEAVARGYAVDTSHPVAVLDPGLVATGLTDGEGVDPEEAAAQAMWALDLPAEEFDGAVLERSDWKKERDEY